MTASNVLFDEDGAFKAGTVLSEAGGSLQVESASGKRTKVKVGGERTLFIQLGLKEKDAVFDRKDIIESVYKSLTSKAVCLDITA